jgi:predicted unusual protein kinase regulating ubiquinone biosynthesis (AarF/ABC1/UbiB family)
VSDDSRLPPSGRFRRFAKLAALSAQLGTDALARGVKRLAGADPTMLSKGTAEKLVATLGELKGAAMKFGQAVSMDSDLLTPEVRAILARLQNQAPSMPYENVARVVTQELGRPPEEAYQHFEHEPMAAASLGQVHRAQLSDGREVAVKVQYPGIAAALTSDLDNLGAVVRALSSTTRALDGRAYFQELRDEMMMEVDYRREASLCRGFAEAARALPELKVPEVVDSHTTQRVLTLELLPGKTLRDFVASEPSAPERFRISRLLIHAIYGPFFLAGEVHSDPHPGNFIILSDGRLGLVDFGSVKRFSPTFVAANVRMFLHSLHGERPDVLALSQEIGVTFDLPLEEGEALIRELLHIAGKPLRALDYDYGNDGTVRELRSLFARHATRFMKIRPPSEAVMFFRALGGLSQNLRLLAGRGNFRSAYLELAELIAAHPPRAVVG